MTREEFTKFIIDLKKTRNNEYIHFKYALKNAIEEYPTSIRSKYSLMQSIIETSSPNLLKAWYKRYYAIKFQKN